MQKNIARLNKHNGGLYMQFTPSTKENLWKRGKSCIYEWNFGKLLCLEMVLPLMLLETH